MGKDERDAKQEARKDERQVRRDERQAGRTDPEPPDLGRPGRPELPGGPDVPGKPDEPSGPQLPWVPGGVQQDVYVSGDPVAVAIVVPADATESQIEGVLIGISREAGQGESPADVKISKKEGDMDPFPEVKYDMQVCRTVMAGMSGSFRAGYDKGELPFRPGDTWYVNVRCPDETHLSLQVGH